MGHDGAAGDCASQRVRDGFTNSVDSRGGRMIVVRQSVAMALPHPNWNIAYARPREERRRDDARGKRIQKRRPLMLGWALTFLVIAIIAAILGFGGVAG